MTVKDLVDRLSRYLKERPDDEGFIELDENGNDESLIKLEPTATVYFVSEDLKRRGVVIGKIDDPLAPY